jgi:uncharacterized protein DUF1573
MLIGNFDNCRTAVYMFVAAVSSMTSTGWAAASPKAAVPAPSFDFGTVKQGETLSHCFEVRNDGSAPLQIEKMQLNLPKMTARASGSIAPGRSENVCVDLGTETLTLKVKAEVTVFVNDPQQPQILLVLTGVIRSPVDLVPMGAVVASIWKGDGAERTITIVNNTPRPLHIRGLDVEGQDFKARFETQKPGEVYKVIIMIPPGLAPGRYTGRVYVNTDSSTDGRIRIPVNILVKNQIYAFPAGVNFGSVSRAQVDSNPGALADLAEWILVKKRKGKFTIKSLTSDLPVLRLTQSPEGASNTFRITVALVGDRLQPGQFAGTIHVITDDPVVPELTIPVSGDIR